MARKGRMGNQIILLGASIGIIFVALGVFAFGGIDPTFFEQFTGLSVVDINNARVQCGDVSCTWFFRSLDSVNSGGLLKESIDLGLINTNEPVIVDWRILIATESFTCETFQKSLRLDVILDDEVVRSFGTTEGLGLMTNIQPEIEGMSGLLEIGIGGNFCTADLAGLRYRISNSDGTASATISFTKVGEQKSMDEILDELMEISPEVEICPQTVDQVCGIDGRTYANRCFAGEAGVAVAHEGVCERDIPPEDMTPEEMMMIEQEENGTDLPELTISTGVATQIFVVVGAVILAIVGIAIFVRRRSAPITEF